MILSKERYLTNESRLFAEAIDDYHNERFEQAIVKLRRLATRTPSNGAIVNNLALAYCAIGKFSNARKHLTPLVASGEATEDSHLLLAMVLHKEGDNEKARDLLVRLSLQTDFSPTANFLLRLGELEFRCKNYLSAKQIFYKGLEIAPDSKELRLGYANSVSKTQSTFEGLDLLKKVAVDFPRYAEAHSSLSSAFLECEDFESALCSAAVATEINPELLDAGINYAVALRHLGRVEETLQVIRDLEVRFKDSQEVRALAASIRYSVGGEEKYLSEMRNIAEHRPTDSDYSLSVATALMEKGRFKLASKYWARRSNSLCSDIYKKFDERGRLWRGQTDFENLLFFADQGLGDQLLFARLLTGFRARGYGLGRITVALQSKLSAILSFADPTITVISVEELKSASLEGYSYGLPLPDLIGYLSPEDISDEKIALLGCGCDLVKPTERVTTVGLSFQSRRRKFRVYKNISEDILLSGVPRGLQVLNLDGDRFSPALLEKYGLSELETAPGNSYDDLSTLVSEIGRCDVVVGISNTTSHISGALGRGTVVLMYHSFFGTFFYWGREGRETPWYKSVTIVRQVVPANWNQPMNELRETLSKRFGLEGE